MQPLPINSATLEAPFPYCNSLGIDLEFFSIGVREAMEVEMKQNIADKVLAIHPYKLPSKEDYINKGRCKTRVYDERKKDNRRTVWAYSEDEMLIKLYNIYFCGDTGIVKLKMDNIFNMLVKDYTEKKKISIKTIKDYQSDYVRFFKDDPIAQMSLDVIKVSDIARFLDRAHIKLSDKDIARGKDCIEKHRHDSIRTIINHIYNYANTYLNANLNNPLLSLSYKSWPYYKETNLEHKVYSREDRVAMLKAFDEMENPNLEDLTLAFILETSARNSEARAIRFEDFHFDAKVPYVRICGMATGSHRDERIKADSSTGKRNVRLTKRLEKIYNNAKALSWSDEYLFVREPDKVIGNEILITYQGTLRALHRLCDAAGVDYLPPHQLRFSDATIMAEEGANIYDIQRRLGHTTPTMAQHYVRSVEISRPSTGPMLDPVNF